jgi:hypothetical protein
MLGSGCVAGFAILDSATAALRDGAIVDQCQPLDIDRTAAGEGAPATPADRDYRQALPTWM